MVADDRRHRVGKLDVAIMSAPMAACSFILAVFRLRQAVPGLLRMCSGNRQLAEIVKQACRFESMQLRFVRTPRLRAS